MIDKATIGALSVLIAASTLAGDKHTIYDRYRRKLGTIDENGVIYDRYNVRRGSIDEGGRVRDRYSRSITVDPRDMPCVLCDITQPEDE